MQESCLLLSLGVPGELLALLEIALYVEPRSAVLEKLRGAINHSHSIMKHIIILLNSIYSVLIPLGFLQKHACVQ
jgi:hypothetical protein